MKTTTRNRSNQARLLHHHIQRIRAFMNAGSRPAQIWSGMKKEPTLPQVRVLLALNILGPSHLKQVARYVGISGSSASEMVERLVEMGWISRRQDPDDRRQVILELTSEIQQRVQRYEKHMHGRVLQILDHLTDEQVDRWIEIAEEVTRVIQPELEGKPNDV